MTLYHYSATPFVLDRTRTYTQTRDDFKPKGLWLSAEAGTNDDWGWKQWCESEDFNTTGLSHRTEVVLHDDANILRVENVAAIDAFSREYIGLYINQLPISIIILVMMYSDGKRVVTGTTAKN